MYVERFSSWKLKSLEDIKEEKERQSSQVTAPSKGGAKWRGGVPVSPTLVMPNTVFHPGMQPWAGRPQRQPYLQGNPYKFVAKATIQEQPPPVAAESPPKTAKSPPKTVESPPNAVEPSTVAAVPKPKTRKTTRETRKIESKKVKDAKSERDHVLQGKLEGAEVRMSDMYCSWGGSAAQVDGVTLHSVTCRAPSAFH